MGLLAKLKALNAFSILAIILGLISLGLGVGPKVYDSIHEEPQRAEITIGNMQITMQGHVQEKNNVSNLAYVSLALSTLAFLCCIFAFMTGENKRVYISALVIIALSLLWYFL